MTVFQASVQKVMEMAVANGMQITEQQAARVVRAGNSLNKKQAEYKSAKAA